MRKTCLILTLICLAFVLASCAFLIPARNHSGITTTTNRIIMETRDSEQLSEETSPISSATRQDLETKPSTGVSSEGSVIEKDFGSYTIPSGWTENSVFSTKSKFIYSRDGEAATEIQNNISVLVDVNKYSLKEKTTFRDEIVNMITKQLGSDSTATLNGRGGKTAQDYTLFSFTITPEEKGSVTVLYYIVADYKFCEICLTNVDESEEADQAAKAIADSFVWKD